MKSRERCEHCGKFARVGGGLFTLYGLEHTDAENVAICQKCYDNHPLHSVNSGQNITYWLEWLNNRLKAVQP